jgi:short-subunit dehydrogenase
MQKTALVTGGSKGIGFAIVHKLLLEGFDVISVSRTAGQLEALQLEFAERLWMLQADFTKPEDVLSVIGKVKGKVSRLDILVNNAGVFKPGQIHNEAEGVFALQMALNIEAPYHLTRGLLPLMMPHQEGYIFNICSTASIIPYVDGGSYCISKHALLGFSKVLREELKVYGIAVSAILPGATFTDSWSGSAEPESRFMRAGNIAECIWFAWKNRENCVMEEILLRPLKGDI